MPLSPHLTPCRWLAARWRTGLDVLASYALHDGPDVLRADLLARFYLDVALPMADKHLTGHLRVFVLCVAEVNDRPCDTVCHLVGVAWVHFLKHDVYLFILLNHCLYI